MTLDAADRRLLAAIEDGLPLIPQPYAAIGAAIGLSEDEVVGRLRRLQDSGTIKRLGLVVRHHELGYRANAMVVWNVADDLADTVGAALARIDFVTLCYRRPRRPPEWPYNLFCMIHGRDRDQVLQQIEALRSIEGLAGAPSAVLFSRRRYKQRGALYGGVSREVA